jgi:hypothetical protein
MAKREQGVLMDDQLMGERALNAIRTIVALHESKDEPSSLVPLEDGLTFQPRFHCKHCQKVYPCPTIEIIRRAMV